MIVIYLKKQRKNSRFYSLVSFTKPHEKPWKKKHSSNLSPNISSLEDETKNQSTLICSEKKYQIFCMLWQYKLDKKFNLTFKENRFLLSSMPVTICFKMLMKSLVNLASPIKWVFNQRLTKIEVGCIIQQVFLDYDRIARLKVSLKVVLNGTEPALIGMQETSSLILMFSRLLWINVDMIACTVSLWHMSWTLESRKLNLNTFLSHWTDFLVFVDTQSVVSLIAQLMYLFLCLKKMKNHLNLSAHNK